MISYEYKYIFIRAVHCLLTRDTIFIPRQGSRYDTYHDTVNNYMSASTFEITRQNKNKNMDINGGFSGFKAKMSPNVWFKQWGKAAQSSVSNYHYLRPPLLKY